MRSSISSVRQQAIIASERWHQREARIEITVMANAVTQRVLDPVQRAVPQPDIVGQDRITDRAATAGTVTGGAIVAEQAFAHGQRKLLQIPIGLDFFQRGFQQRRGLLNPRGP